MSPDTRSRSWSLRRRLSRKQPDRRDLLVAAIVLNTEALAVLAYISLPNVTPTAIRYYLFPFVWINVGLWALVRTIRAEHSRERSPGRRYGAAALAVGYFLVLAYLGGIIAPGHALAGPVGHPPVTDTRIAWLPPGWGPALLYNGALVSLTAMPFAIVGYLALASLVYATVLDAAGSAVGGVLGMLSCVSCTWPVLASLVGGIGGSGLVTTVTTQSYGLSTVVFVFTVCLLSWRPFGRNRE
jgi:hypothetical protein